MQPPAVRGVVLPMVWKYVVMDVRIKAWVGRALAPRRLRTTRLCLIISLLFLSIRPSAPDPSRHLPAQSGAPLCARALPVHHNIFFQSNENTQDPSDLDPPLFSFAGERFYCRFGESSSRKDETYYFPPVNFHEEEPVAKIWCNKNLPASCVKLTDVEDSRAFCCEAWPMGSNTRSARSRHSAVHKHAMQ